MVGHRPKADDQLRGNFPVVPAQGQETQDLYLPMFRAAWLGDWYRRLCRDISRRAVVRSVFLAGTHRTCVYLDETLLLGHLFQGFPSFGSARQKGPTPFGVHRRFPQRFTVVHRNKGLSDLLG